MKKGWGKARTAISSTTRKRGGKEGKSEKAMKSSRTKIGLAGINRGCIHKREDEMAVTEVAYVQKTNLSKYKNTAKKKEKNKTIYLRFIIRTETRKKTWL